MYVAFSDAMPLLFAPREQQKSYIKSYIKAT